MKRPTYDKDYILNILNQLIHDLRFGRIIKFKSKKGLAIKRNGKRIEKILIVRQIEL